jgi:putative methionine-R-sulfoxide reductase with GAF domain
LVLSATEKTLGFERADVLVVEARNLQLITPHGYLKNQIPSVSLDGDKGLTVEAVRKGRSIYSPDIRKDKTYLPALSAKNNEKTIELSKTEHIGILSELVVPIRVGKKVLGVLNVESKKVDAFTVDDIKLLEILASHAAIAISNLRRQAQLEGLTGKLSNLMKNTTMIMNINDLHGKLKVITKAIRKFGWRRVVISLRDEHLESTDLVTLGLTKEENKLLRERKAPGRVWKERLGPSFNRYKLNEFYYLPWSDPWIKQNVHGVSAEATENDVTTYAGVPSKLSVVEMID